MQHPAVEQAIRGNSSPPGAHFWELGWKQVRFCSSQPPLVACGHCPVAGTQSRTPSLCLGMAWARWWTREPLSSLFPWNQVLCCKPASLCLKFPGGSAVMVHTAPAQRCEEPSCCWCSIDKQFVSGKVSPCRECFPVQGMSRLWAVEGQCQLCFKCGSSYFLLNCFLREVRCGLSQERKASRLNVFLTWNLHFSPEFSGSSLSQAV